MDEPEGIARAEAEQILNKIAADFEALDSRIEAAIARVEAEQPCNDALSRLRLAKAAAQKGATLARSKIEPK